MTHRPMTPAQLRAADLRLLGYNLTFEQQRLSGVSPSLLRAVADDVDALSKPVVRVGVAVIVRKGASVLMGLRKGSHGAGTWSFPGGHLDPEESVFGCAVRELEEETGLRYEPTGMRKLTFTNDVFAAEGKHYVTLYVACEWRAPHEPEVREPEKCGGWAWVSQPPSPLFLPVENLLLSGFQIWREK